MKVRAREPGVSMADGSNAIRGVCAAALTPLAANDEPDVDAAVRHCRRLFALGCDALNLLGTTGEAMSFSVAQRLAVMEGVAGGVRADACMTGTGAAAFADAVVLTRAAADLGFAGALVMPPFYFKDNHDDGLVRFFSRLLERVDRPKLRVYLYHFPYLSGVSFSPALVARLCAEFGPAIAGLKDSSGVPGFAESIVAAAPVDVFPSSEASLESARERGFAGCISATVNVTASLAARVWRATAADAATLAREAQQLAALRAAFASYPLVPALRAVTASLTNDPAYRRMLPPLHELSAPDEAALFARLDGIAAFAALREGYACA